LPTILGRFKFGRILLIFVSVTVGSKNGCKWDKWSVWGYGWIGWILGCFGVVGRLGLAWFR